VKDTQLTVDGKPFYFAGFNAYWLIDSGKEGKFDDMEDFFKQAQVNIEKVYIMVYLIVYHSIAR
jgi:hypothetical protein